MATNETCCTENSSTRTNFANRMAKFIYVCINYTSFYLYKYLFVNLYSDVYSVSTWYPASIPEIFTELTNEITRHIKQAQEVNK
jgi:hypothetical protein